MAKFETTKEYVNAGKYNCKSINIMDEETGQTNMCFGCNWEDKNGYKHYMLLSQKNVSILKENLEIWLAEQAFSREAEMARLAEPKGYSGNRY